MTENQYDYLVVGAGLFGSVFAQKAIEAGRTVLVIDKRDHAGGNVYTENIHGINVHKYGAHIFHTNNRDVWNYLQKFADFNRYTNSPLANYKGKLYSLPFNMLTFNKMWGVITPDEARSIIDDPIHRSGISNPKNLEEQAISLVGYDIYEQLIKGYTEKQWGKNCVDLPPDIIKRIPVRFVYDNNYFNALYQGIPIGGYTQMIENMLQGADIVLGVDYLDDKAGWNEKAKKVIYTGPIDAYYDYCFGELEYRSVYFETKFMDVDNYQGNAVINYTDSDTAWTRVIEHKWFEFGKTPDGNDIHGTVVSKEFSCKWEKGIEPYYPINDLKNSELYDKYKALNTDSNLYFGGRLGDYKYYDMDKIVEKAFDLSERLLGTT